MCWVSESKGSGMTLWLERGGKDNGALNSMKETQKRDVFEEKL